jgi:phosphate transporter
MKFSHSLEFNSVVEWYDYYIAYDKLKVAIYDIERHKANLYRNLDGIDVEILDDPQTHQKVRAFIDMLNKELSRVNKFYEKKEAELVETLIQLESKAGFPKHDIYNGTDEEVENIGEDSNLIRATASPLSTHNERASFRNDLIQLYLDFCSLKDYVVLNYTGFCKILKKHDKVLGGNLRTLFLPTIESCYFWKRNVDSLNHGALNEQIEKIVSLFAFVCCDGSIELAVHELSHKLKEFVTWERNTIWRDMVGKERRITAVGVKRVDVSRPSPGFYIPIGKSFSIFIRYQWLSIIFCLSVFAIFLNVNFFDASKTNNCLAILLFVSSLWATEVLPLFVTALLIPFLIMVLKVVHISDDESSKDVAKRLANQMFSPVILLLLGGFSLAGALSKYHIAKSFAVKVLSKIGTKSHVVLLSIMFIATFSSMWISNVAAPVLCLSVITPILRTLEPGNSFAKSLVMGVALSSNIGGMVTPISSPQNIIAMQNMSGNGISWGAWLIVSLPFAIIANILCWLLLLYSYKPTKSTPRIQPIRSIDQQFSWEQYYVLFVTFISIILWCFESVFRDTFGDSGIIALIPMVAFFGTGLLNKDDFNNFLWTVVMLAMGGLCLGYAVNASQLLEEIAKMIETSIGEQSLWVYLFAFCILLTVVASLISHTVSALIVLPVIKTVGEKMADRLGPHGDLLVLGAAFMCSGAMALPVSGFPNITAISLEDSTGFPYLSTKDFLKCGIPMTVIFCLLVASLGYGLMLIIGL